MNSAFRGIGIRALLLILGIVVVGIWLVSLALKIAGAAFTSSSSSACCS